MARRIFFWCVCITLIPVLSLAHPGRTDANGGHTDSKTGTYHTHGGSSSTSSGKSFQDTPSGSAVPRPNPAQTIPITPAAPTPKQKPQVAKTSPSISENHWQVLLNKKCFNGRLEVVCGAGRIDIMTESLVVEVERVSKFKEGFEQAKKYAKATGLSPVLALFIDGDPDGLYQLEAARKESQANGITVMLANCSVSVSDFLETIADATRADAIYWVDGTSGIRHNSACRYFHATSSGREGSKSEGRPCAVCGG
jgi:hypothetical protein